MKQSIQINRTAHYYIQKPEQEVKSILFVIHGYAQLADDFIKDFTALKSSSILVIAPEAISKFYNKEKKVVASWMSSQHRDDEILDYINYLNTLIKSIVSEFGALPINVLGFSQGVSTALRWICNCDSELREVHLCSGSIPPELNKNNLSYNQDIKAFYYYGDDDRLLTPLNATIQIEKLNFLYSDMSTIYFKGRHEIPKEAIDNLINMNLG